MMSFRLARNLLQSPAVAKKQIALMPTFKSKSAKKLNCQKANRLSALLEDSGQAGMTVLFTNHF
ncbi:MAG: hypothetical protein V4642_12080 [Bacteroidota bacterium]